MNNDEFVLLRLERDYREQYGIPDAYLPVPMPMAADLPPEVLLRLLQEHAASSPTWQTFEPAWSRLGIGKLFSEEASSAAWLRVRQDQDAASAQVSCRQIRRALVRARRYSPAVIKCRRGRKWP
ncbi:hypothetical protein WDZ11_22040 (plasmid) [Roseomonas mucosa]|uniref:hypothetical protein n=1 Tax=Roseomonas TaxID=125216 RepID=UPI0015C54E7A|nr:hypothetical protein [Roseomonas sp. TAS13]